MSEKFSVEQARQIPISDRIREMGDWKQVPLKEGGEQLVALGPFSEYGQIFTNSLYFGELIDSPYRHKTLAGSLLTQFVRRGVADRLARAQALLPETLRLVVFDGYRPLEVQQALFDFYLEQLRNKKECGMRFGDYKSEQELREITQHYVSLPSTDPSKPSPHNTGGAVDLTIVEVSPEAGKRLAVIDQAIPQLPESEWAEAYLLEAERSQLMRHGHYLDFGTALDHGGPRSELRWMDWFSQTTQDLVIQGNRRLLFHLMDAVGFEGYYYEWWHYNAPESQMGVWNATRNPYRRKYRTAKYGAAQLTAEQLDFEQMRREHHRGTQLMYGSDQLAVVRASLERHGSPIFSRYPQAEMISPEPSE